VGALMNNSSQLIGCGFWIRVAAYLLDHFIFNLATIALAFVASFFVPLEEISNGLTTGDPRLGLLLGTFILLYRVSFEASAMRGTPGKYFVGLQVVTNSGDRLRPFHALWRNLVRYILLSITFFLEVFTMIFPGRKRTVHDMLSGTIVIKR
jgi:uncharacterized RDD family membrane protein YckC